MQQDPTFADNGNHIRTSGRQVMENMGVISKDMSKDDQVHATADFFLNKGILNSPIRKSGDTAYYFDKNGIYRADKGFKKFPNLKEISGRDPWHHLWGSGYMDLKFNHNLWRHAVASFPEGASLNDCVQIFLESKRIRQAEMEYIDRLVGRIEAPSIEREPGNDNPRSFDRIRVSVSITKGMFESWSELKDAVIENRKEISRMVLKRIEDKAEFRRFGIPVNALKATSISLSRDCTLEYIFEPKLRSVDPHDRSKGSFEAVLSNAQNRATKQSTIPKQTAPQR